MKVTFQVLENSECNFLSHLSKEDQEIFKQDLNLLILATDMSRHAEILSEFKKRSPFENGENLTYLKMILIKACDVSNEIRPPKIAEPWAEKLLQEYFQQVRFVNWLKNGLFCQFSILL